MPHQCVHCGKLYDQMTKELIEGCSCGSKFFFYLKPEQYEKLRQKQQMPLAELGKQERKNIEKDVREMIGIDEEEPVILDLESVRILEPGKFEIDIVKLFSQKMPVIYKLEEGKYIIDLASTFKLAEKKE